MSVINKRTEVKNGSTYTIPSGNTFTNNTGISTIQFGAAFYVDGSTLNHLDEGEVLFDFCVGRGGGAIYMSKGSTVTLSNCTFTNDKSVGNSDSQERDSGWGGAVSVSGRLGEGTNFLTLNNCKFENNNANMSGGAIFLENATFSMNNVTFSGNEGGKHGGGAVYFGGGATQIASGTATNVYFNGNHTKNGGNGGAAYVSEKSTVSIFGGSVSNNYVGGSEGMGGGIFVASEANLTMEGVNFDGNIAAKGGAIDNVGNVEISSMTLSNNVASVRNDQQVVAGGAVDNSGTFTATSVTFTGNTVKGFNSETVDEKSYGGAVYNTNVFGATNSTFSGNTAVTGGAIYNSGTATIKDSSFETISDSIYNDGTIFFQGTNTLNAALSGDGISYSGENDVVLKGTGTVSQTYVAQGFKTSFENLKLDDAEILGGNLDNGVTKAELYFKDITMTSNAKIYGAGTAETKNITVAGDVALDFTGTLNSYNGQILAGGKAAGSKTITVGTVSLTVNVEGKVGIIYAGAELTDHAKFSATAMNTTIDNGTFYSYVGNGCRVNGEISGTMDATVNDTASLTINGGVFKNIVYAGAFASGNTVKVGNEKEGNTNLTINGGSFEQMVFGGNGANKIANSTQALSTVDGNVSVLVNSGEKAGDTMITFNKSLVGGSVGEGKISGKVTVTFTGIGDNLRFGDTAYVGGDSQKAERYADTSKEKSYVSGDRYLVFNEFEGTFGGNIRNGFDEVSFAASSVTFEGQQEVDLRYIKTWNFDVSDSWTDLTWTDGENDFKDDTINLTGDAGVFMIGSADTIKGWDTAHYNVNNIAVDIDRISCTDKGNGKFELSLLANA